MDDAGQRRRWARPWMVPLLLALATTGWLLAEVGRFPWVVYGLMTIDKAVSPNVPVSALLISLRVTNRDPHADRKVSLPLHRAIFEAIV